MILLKDLFVMLATGEFSNISLKRDQTNSIAESEYEKVIGHINLGLVEIYKRFKLLENELVLHANPRVSKYYLQPKRMAIADNLSDYSYIEFPEDSDGFINIVEIKDIFDEEGNQVIKNNRFLTPSIIQMAPDVLKISGLEGPRVFTVLYQAHPSKIILDDDFDPTDYMLYIPETILEPLLYYIASRVYKPMGSNNSTANADKSIGYQQQYELACQKIDLYGLDIENNDGPNTFSEDGWV